VTDLAHSKAPEPIELGGRERVLYTAYDLFVQHGVRTIGIDRIIAEAGVAKKTLYRHFASKDALVTAVLELREERWTHQWLAGEIERRADTPRERLLAIFDAFDEWFRRDDYAGCLFVNTLLESRDLRPGIGRAAASHLDNVLALVRDLAEATGVADPEDLAHDWQILMQGSIVHALQGDVDAALRARKVAALLLERHGAGR
jgi:AcrR family transcriptional regulator